MPFVKVMIHFIWSTKNRYPLISKELKPLLLSHIKQNSKDFQLSDLPHTEEQLRKIPPFEFQNWAVIALGAIPNKTKVNDFGIDGKLYPIEMGKKKKAGTDLFGETDIYYPIQVKQRDKAGRPIDSFETAIRRDGRRKGYFISFDYSSDAIKEIKRLDKEGEIEIIPITVKDLLRRESFGIFDWMYISN